MILTGVATLILISELYSQYLMYRDDYQRVRYQTLTRQEVDYRLFFYDSGYKSLDAGLDWLKGRAKPDDIVAGSMPHWVYLRTGLKAVMPPWETNPRTAQNLLDSVPVTYIVLDTGSGSKLARDYMMPLVRNAPQILEDRSIRMKKARSAIYERLRG